MKRIAINRAIGSLVVTRQDHVAQRAERHLDVPERVIALAAIGAIGRMRLAVQFALAVSGDQPLIEDQAHHHTDGETAAAEAEAEQFVIGIPPVAASEFVEIDDVALQTEAERAAEYGKRLEGGGSDAVVVERNLIGAREIERFEHTPDIGTPDLRRGVTRAVGQQNDFPAHASPRNDAARR